jgi:hypothetical protein
MTDVDLYINFALHAIYGMLGEADTIMRRAGDSVRRVADRLAEKIPVMPAPIHRGLLLDPAVPFAPDPKATFLSWSEDLDVALWFACPRSAVSEPVAQQKPRARGFLVELAAPRSRVLFYHAWTRAFGGLAPLAIAHPLMGEEGRRQIEWSLRTQREIITEPVPDLLPTPAGELDAAALEALERRLSPPWIIEEEGIRS